MKKIIIVVLVLFFGCAKVDEFKIQRDYYNFIDRAELSIIKSDNDSAIKSYESAFDLKCRHFAKDYYNASILYMLEQKNCDDFLYNLAQRGVSPDELLRKSIFQKYITKDKYTKLKNIYNNTIIKTNDLREKIDSLLSEDQKYRELGEYKKIEFIDSLNSVELKKIIAEYGSLDELNYGYEGHIVYFSPYHYLIWHQRTNSYDLDYYIEFLRHQSKLGYIHPNVASRLLEVLNNDLKMLYSTPWYCVGYLRDDGTEFTYPELFTYPLSKEEIERVDSFRSEIGFESLYSQIEKKKFAIKDTLYMWYYELPPIYFSHDSIGMVQKIKEGVVLREQ